MHEDFLPNQQPPEPRVVSEFSPEEIEGITAAMQHNVTVARGNYIGHLLLEEDVALVDQCAVNEQFLADRGITTEQYNGVLDGVRQAAQQEVQGADDSWFGIAPNSISEVEFNPLTGQQGQPTTYEIVREGVDDDPVLGVMGVLEGITDAEIEAAKRGIYGQADENASSPPVSCRTEQVLWRVAQTEPGRQLMQEFGIDPAPFVVEPGTAPAPEQVEADTEENRLRVVGEIAAMVQEFQTTKPWPWSEPQRITPNEIARKAYLIGGSRVEISEKQQIDPLNDTVQTTRSYDIGVAATGKRYFWSEGDEAWAFKSHSLEELRQAQRALREEIAAMPDERSQPPQAEAAPAAPVAGAIRKNHGFLGKILRFGKTGN